MFFPPLEDSRNVEICGLQGSGFQTFSLTRVEAYKKQKIFKIIASHVTPFWFKASSLTQTSRSLVMLVSLLKRSSLRIHIIILSESCGILSLRYNTIIRHLIPKRDVHKAADGKEGTAVRRRGRPRKKQNLQGKRLFDEQSSSEEEEEEDSISGSDQEEKHEEEDDEPLIHSIRASSKLRSLKLSKENKKGPTRTVEELATPKTSGTYNITSFSLCSTL